MTVRKSISGPIAQDEEPVVGSASQDEADLQRAVKALTAKEIPYTELWEYYDGDQPVVYASSRLREIFRNVDARVVENWCAVVVDAVADRLRLQGITAAEDKPATELLNELWQRQRLQLEAKSVHEAVLAIGEAFMIVWPGEAAEGSQPVQIYYNDPRLCHVFYDPENPRAKQYAAKWWIDGELKRRLTLYYPDRLVYYISQGKATSVTTWRSFQPADPSEAPNPFEAVPVFHFRLESRVIKGELANVITIQNAINKLLLDMMVCAEFGAFRQRWVISNAGDLVALQNAPYEHWFIPAGDGLGQPTSVGQFDASDLKNYTDAIEKLAADIGRITNTPKHFLFAQGGDPSGEALIALEAPLNKKVQDRIDHLTPTWREVAAFALKVAGQEVDEQGIAVSWAAVETIQPKTQAEIRESSTRAGIPLVTALRREGWAQADLDQMAKDKKEASAQGQSSLAAALVEAQRRSTKPALPDGG
jgi:hypothetical protein